MARPDGFLELTEYKTDAVLLVRAADIQAVLMRETGIWSVLVAGQWLEVDRNAALDTWTGADDLERLEAEQAAAVGGMANGV